MVTIIKHIVTVFFYFLVRVMMDFYTSLSTALDYNLLHLLYLCAVFCEGGSAQSEEEGAALSRGSGVCKWFNVRMGFGFLSMNSRDGATLEQPLDVFVHQVRPWLL